MTFILGKKIGMSQMFKEDGSVIPMTLISAGPVTVTQIKTKEQDGYEAMQVGYDETKKIDKPKQGHLKDLPKFRTLRECPLQDSVKRGDTFDVSAFEVGQEVKVSADSKGRGFQGAVKRHGFHGMPASHGHHHVLRHVGSIGQRFPQHTLPGMRMAGRMGGNRFTVRGLKVVMVDKEKNLIAVKGATPGRRGSLLEIVNI